MINRAQYLGKTAAEVMLNVVRPKTPPSIVPKQPKPKPPVTPQQAPATGRAGVIQRDAANRSANAQLSLLTKRNPAVSSAEQWGARARESARARAAAGR